MSFSGASVRGSEPGIRAHFIRCVGGASAISKSAGGTGMSVSRSDTGSYALAWDDIPGTFLGWSANFGAATPGDVAGHTAVRDTYSSKSLPFLVYNASDAAHDLAADEYIDIVVWFAETT